LKHTAERHEIIVVDDGSSGKVQDRLSSLAVEYSAKFIACEKNQGFAKACNIGIRESNGHIVILVNNDTLQINKTIDNLANFMLFTGAATTGVKLLYEDYSVQHGGVWHVPGNPHGYWDHIGRFAPRWDSVVCRIRNGLCTGALLGISRNTLNTVGLLDERYGMAVEDIDFQLRCMETGLRIYYCGLIEAFHLEGRTRGNTAREKAKHSKWTSAEDAALDLFFERWEGIDWKQFQIDKIPF